MSRRLIERTVAAHLELPNASALAGSADAELDHANRFVERLRSQAATGEADEPGCYGQRAQARARAWADEAHADEQDAPPLPLLQALLSVLTEEGHDVSFLHVEVAPLISLQSEVARRAAGAIERARTISRLDDAAR